MTDPDFAIPAPGVRPFAVDHRPGAAIFANQAAFISLKSLCLDGGAMVPIIGLPREPRM